MRPTAPADAENLPRLLNVEDAAAELGIPYRSARKLFDTRAFPLVRVGRRLYVRQDDVSAWLASRTIPAKG